MTSMIKKVIPATVGLLLLAGSPAFAAEHHAHHDTLHHVFISSRVASSFDAVPGWVEPPRSSVTTTSPATTIRRSLVVERRCRNP
jgi:hypothetical protein